VAGTCGRPARESVPLRLYDDGCPQCLHDGRCPEAQSTQAPCAFADATAPEWRQYCGSRLRRWAAQRQRIRRSPFALRAQLFGQIRVDIPKSTKETLGMTDGDASARSASGEMPATPRSMIEVPAPTGVQYSWFGCSCAQRKPPFRQTTEWSVVHATDGDSAGPESSDGAADMRNAISASSSSPRPGPW